MGLSCRTIQISDLNDLLSYEQKKLVETFADESERQFASWSAKWRQESLEHYLPLGWSFLIKDEEQLVGYFIAQPLLFLDGQTQSLWVEHLSYSSLLVRDQLCELAYKLAREKHFQRVFFPQHPGVANSVAAFKPESWQAPVLCVKTTKA